MAKEIKRVVRERCGLVVSVGVATNKLCAKVGSDLRKPDGLVIVPAGSEAAFLAPLSLERLWGVGPRTREVLAGWGIRTIGELAAFDRTVLETRLGAHGTDIWERANGIDEGQVTSGHVPKSVGHSHTFDENTLDPRKIESTLLRLAEGVGRRLRDHTLRGRTITMTLRVAPFETRTRQRTLREPTDDDVTIFRIARQLLRDALKEDREGGRTSPVRLVGVSVSGITQGEQLGLFDAARHARLNAALDTVRARFGDQALDRASAREVKERRRFSGHRSR
jgi:DNA polymerase-4